MEKIVQANNKPTEDISKSRRKLIIKNALILPITILVIGLLAVYIYGQSFPNSGLGGFIIIAVFGILLERVLIVGLITTVVVTFYLTRKIQTVVELKSAGKKSLIFSSILTILISGATFGVSYFSAKNRQTTDSARYKAAVEKAPAVTDIHDCFKKDVVLAWGQCMHPLVIDKASYDICKDFSNKIANGQVKENVANEGCEEALMKNIHDGTKCREIVGPDWAMNCWDWDSNLNR